jgi:thioredoxin reductase (NADPH)
MTDCIVIGAGLSGVSAALTLAQRRLKVEVIATSATETRAGKLGITTYYPGGSATATGQSLMEHVLEQLQASKAQLTTGTVQGITSAATGFELTLANGDKRSCKSIIVATGIVHHGHTALPGEDTFFGKGVFYQMPVDGPLYAGKALVAAGKTVAIIEELLSYCRLFEKTYLIVPAAKLEIPEDLQERLQRNTTIEVIYSASIKEIQGLTGIGSVVVQAAGQARSLHAQAVWMPGHSHFGNTAFLEGVVDLSETKTPLVTQQLATSRPGLFACGDVLCAQHQHPSITAAQGVIAAYSCEQFLKTSV